MKLIDADEAFRVLSDYYHHRTEEQHDALREALDRVPEAGVKAVADWCRRRSCAIITNELFNYLKADMGKVRKDEDIVYCMDCKYCNVVEENEWLDVTCTWYRDKSFRPKVELTHFCRRGERRTE